MASRRGARRPTLLLALCPSPASCNSRLLPHRRNTNLPETTVPASSTTLPCSRSSHSCATTLCFSTASCASSANLRSNPARCLRFHSRADDLTKHVKQKPKKPLHRLNSYQQKSLPTPWTLWTIPAAHTRAELASLHHCLLRHPRLPIPLRTRRSPRSASPDSLHSLRLSARASEEGRYCHA
jgi:hypothetical protein